MPESIKIIKQGLRRIFRQMRIDMPCEEKAERDRLIAQSFLALGSYRACKTLLIYYSTEIEVDTHTIINRAFADGKRVAFPVCRENGEMDFYTVESIGELLPDAYGIPAPEAHPSRLVDSFGETLCVVPALAYDLNGFRLGFGKGFYDRYIGRTGVKTIGLCYESFVVEKLAVDEFDCSADALLTDTEYRNFGKL